MLEYDNAAKWAALFRRMPSWLRASIVIVVVLTAFIWAYIQLGPLRQLKSKNTRLKNELVAAERRADDLKDKKDELHREILHLKGIVSPLQKKAEELYPELESAIALAKLAEDLQTVRSLATKDVYKPLSTAQKEILVQRLQEIRGRHDNLPKVVIAVEQGNSSRMRVASDLKGFLISAGFTVDLHQQQIFRTDAPPDVCVTLNPANLQIVQELANAIGQGYINKEFRGTKDEKMGTGEIEIEINGDPLFSDTGLVTFR